MHCTRDAMAPSIEPAIERASTVFAVPGTSSKRTCPRQVSAASTSLIRSRLPANDRLDVREQPLARRRCPLEPLARLRWRTSLLCASNMPSSGAATGRGIPRRVSQQDQSLGRPVRDQLGDRLEESRGAGARRPRAAGRPDTAGQALMPARARADQRRRPVSGGERRGPARRTWARRRHRAKPSRSRTAASRIGATRGCVPVARVERVEHHPCRSRAGAGGRCTSSPRSPACRDRPRARTDAPLAYAIGVSTPPNSPGQTRPASPAAGPVVAVRSHGPLPQRRRASGCPRRRRAPPSRRRRRRRAPASPDVSVARIGETWKS